VSESLG